MSTEPSSVERANEELSQIAGHVKWFDSASGYGFITPTDGTGDILLRLECVRQFGLEGVVKDASVPCEVIKGSRGRMATKLVSLDASTADPVEQQNREPQHLSPPSGEPIDALVKWFNQAKGYGFVSRRLGAPDLFLHLEVLRNCGLSELHEGQAVRVRVGHDPLGDLVSEIALKAAQPSC